MLKYFNLIIKNLNPIMNAILFNLILAMITMFGQALILKYKTKHVLLKLAYFKGVNAYMRDQLINTQPELLANENEIRQLSLQLENNLPWIAEIGADVAIASSLIAFLYALTFGSRRVYFYCHSLIINTSPFILLFLVEFLIKFLQDSYLVLYYNAVAFLSHV